MCSSDLIPEIDAAECYLSSRIGQQVGEPHFVELRLAAGAQPPAAFRKRVEPIVARELAQISSQWRTFVGGAVVF
mgnify:FL=1